MGHCSKSSNIDVHSLTNEKLLKSLVNFIADFETLLLATGGELRQLQIATGLPDGDITLQYSPIVPTGTKVKSIDVDVVNRIVYWTDTVHRKIYRCVSYVYCCSYSIQMSYPKQGC